MPAPAGASSSYSPELRRRADHLVELAAEIERTVVLRLPDVVAAADAGWSGRRARLCEHMLETNLHQLHRAADELRHTARRFRQRADDLDAALLRQAA
ncbi:MAG: hypothetical protein HKN41_12535 [Ilumatobacter sp.]|nr:hypothetical protein [Ilumatobacter sp.]